MKDRRGWAARFGIAVLAFSLFVGLFPRESYAQVLPPVVAPPITGLCTTPVGVLACIAYGAAVAGVTIWAAQTGGGPDEEVGKLIGMGPSPGRDGTWCMQAPTYYPNECLGSESGMLLGQDWLSGFENGVYDGFPEDAAEDLTHQSFQVWEPVDPLDFEAVGMEGVLAVQRECDSAICPITGVDGAHTVPAGEGFRQDLYFDTDQPLCESNQMIELPNQAANPVNFHSLESCFVVSIVEWSGIGNGAPSVNSSNSLLTKNLRDPATETCNINGNRHRNWGIGSSVFGYYICQGAGGTMHPHGIGGVEDVRKCQPPLRECGHVFVGMTNATGTGYDWSTWIELERMAEFPSGVVATITQCRAPDGTVTPRLSSSPDGLPLGVNLPMPDMQCLPGEIPISSVVQICAQGSLTQCVEVGSWELPQIETPNWECLYLMATPEPCPMWVEHWTGSEWEVCLPLSTCLDWWEASDRDINYRCGWGGDYYAATQCIPLRDFYGTEEIIDTNPGNPQPDPGTGGDPVQIGGPVPPATAQPTKTWLTNLVNQWATGSITGQWFDSCWPSGWGLLNPLQWVLRPIVCALTFLFVPTVDLELKAQELYDYAATKNGLGHIVAGGELLGSVEFPSPGGTCGYGFPSIDVGDFTLPPLPVVPCPSSLGVSAQAASLKSMMSGVVAMGSVLLVLRWISLKPVSQSIEEGE